MHLLKLKKDELTYLDMSKKAKQHELLNLKNITILIKRILIIT